MALSLPRSETIKRLAERDALMYALSERKLAHYVKAAWKLLEPNNPLMWGWHLDYLCEHLEAVALGQINRIIFNIPPRNLKSILVSVCYPSWRWIRVPERRFLFTSYSQKLSTKHSVDRRQLLESPWYQDAWNDRFSISIDQNEKMKFSNNKRGHMIATSMGGSATGEGGDELIVDDPIDTSMAKSKLKREKSVEDFDRKFTSRLNDKKNGVILIVMQRLHERDHTGHILAKDAGYMHVKLPAIAEERQRLVFPVSKKIITRERGDILHPAREGLIELEKIKKDLGSQAFAGQYQQRPTAEEGGLIKREWIKYYREKDLPPRYEEELISVDCTFKNLDTSDFVAGQVWSRFGPKCYLRGRVKERLDIIGTIEMIIKLSTRFPKAHTKLVEDKANGSAVIQLLKNRVSGLIAVEPKDSKISRLNAIAPFWEAGDIYLPHPDEAPWILEYVEELVNFPNAANDDEVDATSQALTRLKANMGIDFTKNLIPKTLDSFVSGLRGGTAW
jgi:predicted phage terminase large subunit-like protein